MIEESINYKLSINDCFKINEYLVDGTPCSFKKTFNIGYGNVDVFVEIGRGNVVLKIKDSKVLDKKNYKIVRNKDIKDIFGLYSVDFYANGKTHLGSMGEPSLF